MEKVVQKTTEVPQVQVQYFEKVVDVPVTNQWQAPRGSGRSED